MPVIEITLFQMDKYIKEINDFQSQNHVRPRLSFWRRTLKKKEEPATIVEKKNYESYDEK